MIAQAEQEASKLNKGNTNLPANLAKEYGATWTSKAGSFKRMRAMIDKTLQGNDQMSPEQFGKKVNSAEQELTSYKGEFQRYLTLSRSYDKMKNEKQQA